MGKKICTHSTLRFLAVNDIHMVINNKEQIKVVPKMVL